MIQQRVSSIGNSTDAELLEQYLQAGNQDAFAEVVRRNEHAVLRVCRQILRSNVDIDDAFQATFLVLLRRAREVRWQPSLRGWLVAVAHRIAVRSLAGQKRTSLMLDEPADNKSRDQQSDLSWREACQVLHQELNQLKDQFRLPLLLCYLQGYSRDEAAQLLGCSIGSVKANLERGRKLLRLRLEQRGITLTAGLLTLLARPLTSEALTKPVSLHIQTILQGNASARAMAFARSATVSGGLWAVRVSLSILVLMMGTVAWVGWQSGKVVASSNTVSPSLPVIEAMQKGSTATEEMVEVTGTVVDPAGKPVSQCQIGLARLQQMYQPGELRLITSTDEQGRFQLRTSSQPQHLVAIKDGLGMAYQLISDVDAKKPVRLQLQKEQIISGVVMDEKEQPLSGAVVSLRNLWSFDQKTLTNVLKPTAVSGLESWLNERDTGLFLNQVKQFTTTTNGDGTFRLTGAPENALVQVTISYNGRVTSHPLVIASPIFVNDTNDEQKISATQLQTAYLKNLALRSNETLEQTRARIGSYRTFRILEPAEFKVTLIPAVAVQGYTRNLEGKPVAGITVTGHGSRTQSDADGKYILEGLAPSENYTVQTVASDKYLGSTASVVHRDVGAIRVDLQLRPGTILKGKVVDGKTGKGKRAQIEIQPISGNPLLNKHNLVRQVSTRTNADGTFRTIAPPGDLIVTAAAYDPTILEPNPYIPATILPSHTQLLHSTNPRSSTITIAGSNESINLYHAYQIVELPAEGESEVELTLVRGKERTIRLVDPEGKPVEGASIVGLDSNNVLYAARQSTAQVVGLTASDKERPVYVIDRDRKLGAFAVVDTSSTEPVTIKLQPLASYQARLVGLDAKPLQGIELRLSPNVKQGWHPNSYWQLFPKVASDADGRIAFTNIIPDMKLMITEVKTGPAQRMSRITYSAFELKPGENRNVGDVRMTSSMRGNPDR